uniref:Uncharacterized protein TCIL3000_11_8200 n=1 Tax=Trypanosoma congolense (strain IL3000) TaxID=1068625 RepID=G0V149_TRYCI|nr:unnamed protein product [Trypanosoma congolense IL3000]
MLRLCFQRNPLLQSLVRCSHRHCRSLAFGRSRSVSSSPQLSTHESDCVSAQSPPDVPLGRCRDGSNGACAAPPPSSRTFSKALLPHCDGVHPLKWREPRAESQTDLWELSRMLFSLKNHNTCAVTCIDAERRLQGMRLLPNWAVDKLFRSNDWVTQVQENGESAPLYRNVVGKHRIMRHMLNTFVSNRDLWCDELAELLQLVVRKNSRLMDNKRFHKKEAQGTKAAADKPCRNQPSQVSVSDVDSAIDGIDNIDFVNFWRALREIIDCTSFYSYGLQDALWEFSHYQRSSLENPEELWHIFVAFQRNTWAPSLAKGPQFSSHDLFSVLTEAEFKEVAVTESVEAAEGGECSEEVSGNVTSESSEPPDCTSQVTQQPVIKELKEFDCEGEYNHYVNDAQFMRLIEPAVVTYTEHGISPNADRVLPAMLSKGSAQSTNCRPLWGEGRGIVNPANGEMEDPHLTQLWELFQKMRLDELIDIHRIGCGRFEVLQEEVWMDVVVRRALLLLFFARDEVRAITPPAVTYRRLSSLHNELLFLSTWMLDSSRGKISQPTQPLPFEELPLHTQLSYSCFGQLHAPRHGCLYSLPKSAATPEELYQQYCKMYPALNDTDAAESTRNGAENPETQSNDTLVTTEGRLLARYECLNDLQKSALRFPFSDDLFFSTQKAVETRFETDLFEGSAFPDAPESQTNDANEKEEATSGVAAPRKQEDRRRKPKLNAREKDKKLRGGRPRKVKSSHGGDKSGSTQKHKRAHKSADKISKKRRGRSKETEFAGDTSEEMFYPTADSEFPRRDTQLVEGYTDDETLTFGDVSPKKKRKSEVGVQNSSSRLADTRHAVDAVATDGSAAVDLVPKQRRGRPRKIK